MPRKLLITIFILTACTLKSYSQNSFLSPYSRFGIGDIQKIQKPRNLGMGGISMGLVDKHDLSYLNPASYMNVDSMSVVFDVSFNYMGSTIREKSGDALNKSTSNSASINTMNLAFPITKWLKSSFGLVPTSSMSYDTKRVFNEDPPVGEYLLNHTGSGGFNKVYLGLALGTNRIAIGANVNYHFGSTQQNADLVFYDTLYIWSTMTDISKYFDGSGIGYDFGIQYRQPLGKNYTIGFGASFSPSYKIKGKYKKDIFSVHTGGTDTISYGDRISREIVMPASYAVGLSFQKNGRWLLAAEYNFQDFSKFKSFEDDDSYIGEYWNFKIGGEVKGNRYSDNFLNRMTYRAGYNYGKDYLSYNNKDLYESVVSLGFGIPIKRSFSTIDISFEFGKRGNYNDGQIQDNFNRITIGISGFEIWFMRRKFD